MRAIDTNVLVRLVTRDDRRQVESAERFVAKVAWVSHLIVDEMSWVLDSVYQRTQIATVIEMLLDHEKLTIQDPDVVEAAPADIHAAEQASPISSFSKSPERMGTSIGQL